MRTSALFRFLFTGNRTGLAFLWLLGLLILVLSPVAPQQVGRLTTLFGAGRQVAWAPVYTALLFLVGAQLFISLLSYWKRKTEVYLQESMVRKLTLDLFARLLRFPADFFRDNEVERINARALEDSARVVKFWIDAAVGVPLAVASILVFGALMVWDNWFLGLCMVPLSLLSGYFVFFDRRIQQANQRGRETWDTIRAEANQVVGGVSELRSHGAFDYGLNTLRRSFDENRIVMVEVGRLMALFQATSPFVATVQTGVLYWLGAALCIAGSGLAGFAGEMTWGEIITFMLLAQLFQRPVFDVANFILQWRMAGESMRRVNEYLERPCAFEHSPSNPDLPPEGVDLAFDRASVVAPNGVRILNDVSLTVRPGEHVALAGPAGCGKSTLIGLLTRGVEPSSGRLLLGGRRVEEYDVLSLAREFGYVPQKPILFNTSIRNNILLGLRRPSAQSVDDADGSIAVDRFSGLDGRDGLDRELLNVVRLVGLEVDVFRKCLDNPLPLGGGSVALRERLGELRSAVSARMREVGAELVIPFDPDRYLPGTLGENLWRPGFHDPKAPEMVLDALTGTALLDDLLAFGHGRFQSERALAVRALSRAPRLLEFLPTRGKSAPQADVPADSPSTSLRNAPRSVQLVLLEFALEGDADAAREAGGGEAFERKVLEARRTIDARTKDGKGGWKPLGAGEYLEGVPLRENLLGGRVDARLHGAPERVDQALRQVLEAAGLLPTVLLLGLEFRVGEGGKFLSGGQRQKVAIARILLKNPSVLLLDEATASLDEMSQAQIVKLVRDHFAGRTVVAISHRLATIRDYDRVVVLDSGQVAQVGAFDQLAASEGILRNLVRQERGEVVSGQDAASPAPAPAGKGAAPADGMALRNRLALCPIFRHLSSDQLAFLERIAQVVQCPAGAVLFERGDAGKELYLILDGEVEFFARLGRRDEARTQVVNTYGPGKAFGELALFGNGLRTLGARTKTEARLCVVERESLLHLIAADPQIAVALLESVSGRLAALTDLAHADADAPPGENILAATKKTH